MGKLRMTMGKLRMTMGKLRMTMGKLRMTDFIVYQCLLIVRGV